MSFFIKVIKNISPIVLVPALFSSLFLCDVYAKTTNKINAIDHQDLILLFMKEKNDPSTGISWSVGASKDSPKVQSVRQGHLTQKSQISSILPTPLVLI